MNVRYVLRKDHALGVLWMRHEPGLTRELWPTSFAGQACEYVTPDQAQAAANAYETRYHVGGWRVVARMAPHVR